MSKEKYDLPRWKLSVPPGEGSCSEGGRDCLGAVECGA